MKTLQNKLYAYWCIKNFNLFKSIFFMITKVDQFLWRTFSLEIQLYQLDSRFVGVSESFRVCV